MPIVVSVGAAVLMSSSLSQLYVYSRADRNREKKGNERGTSSKACADIRQHPHCCVESSLVLPSAGKKKHETNSDRKMHRVSLRCTMNFPHHASLSTGNNFCRNPQIFVQAGLQQHRGMFAFSLVLYRPRRNVVQSDINQEV